MKWLHSLSSLLLISFSVLILVLSLRIGIGSFDNPGPGFMGFLASILLFLLTVIILGKETMKPARQELEGHSMHWKSLTKPFVLTMALCCYAFILEILGYLVSTFFLMFVMLLINNPRKWALHIVNALIIVNVTYLIFNKVLRVLLPSGAFRISW